MESFGGDKSVKDDVSAKAVNVQKQERMELSFQMGNTPDFYASNKTELEFNDLIDFVEKKKPLPEDSWRSSSMSISRNSTANTAGMK